MGQKGQEWDKEKDRIESLQVQGVEQEQILAVQPFCVLSVPFVRFFRKVLIDEYFLNIVE